MSTRVCINIRGSDLPEGGCTLSKGRLTRIKYKMLYVKPKVQLSRVGDIDYPLNLRCNVVVSFVSQVVVEGVKKRWIKKIMLAKILTTVRLGVWEGSIGYTANLQHMD